MENYFKSIEIKYFCLDILNIKIVNIIITIKKFILIFREEAEKYMDLAELENEPQIYKDKKKKKRRVRPIPLTSKIPLYDKLVAAKEERLLK